MQVSKPRLCAVMVLLLGFSGVAGASPRWEALYSQFRQQANPAEVAQVEAALSASPKVELRLRDLADRGLLSAMTLVDAEVVNPQQNLAIHPHRTVGAAALDGQLLLGRPFLAQLRARQEVASPVDNAILPDNTVYLLSHLAYHLEQQREWQQAGLAYARAYQAAEQAADAQAQIASAHAQLLIAYTRHEAGAWLQGWNDTFHAAKAAHPTLAEDELIPRVLRGLDEYLYAGDILVKVVSGRYRDHLQVSSNGIADTASHRDALALVLMDDSTSPAH